MDNLQEKAILDKYLKAPTNDEIFGFIKDLGVTYAQFERYFEIPEGVIRQVKGGFKPLPVKFWPIIYEKVVPTYGLSYQKAEKQNKRPVTPVVTVESTTRGALHSRISSLNKHS